MRLHELFAEQDPGERDAQGENDEEVAVERGLALRMGTSMASEDDESGAESGTDESDPADGIEALACKEDGGDSEQDGHGTDHEGGVADSGVREPVKLQKKLNGDSEGGGDEKNAYLGGAEADTVKQSDWEQTDRGEEETIEHHVLHAHFIESETAEVKAGTPEAACNCACAITEKGGARAEGGVRGHISF